MKLRFHTIGWDVERKSDLKKLPTEITREVDEDFDPSEDGADLLSDEFGFCVTGYQFEVLGKKFNYNLDDESDLEAFQAETAGMDGISVSNFYGFQGTDQEKSEIGFALIQYAQRARLARDTRAHGNIARAVILENENDKLFREVIGPSIFNW